MAPKTQTFASPRHLVFRHARRLLRAQSASLKETDDPPLAPGQERLRSFFIPGLQTGEHTIHVEQPIVAGNASKTLESFKRFNVINPRFALPNDAIHSSYPPTGHQTGVECLPNVLFNDAKLLWESVGSWDAQKYHDQFPDQFPGYSRNRTPWLAVFAFTEDELKLSAADLSATGIFQDVSSLSQEGTQSSNFTVNMLVSDVSKIKDTVSPIIYSDQTDEGIRSEIVLLPPRLFEGLFTQYDANGAPVDAKHPYVYHHRYLAHRRDINTQGMAQSGASADEDDNGIFGVLLSHRTGPVDITAPTTVYVHVVSIEDVEQMQPWPVASDKRFVAMPSLYSWSYVCMPPDAPNVWDEFHTLGESMQPLAPLVDPELLPAGPLGQVMMDRMRGGFSLSRYRVQTGEETSCFMRGPFIPTPVPELPKYWTKTSMCGSDLQILDQNVGLMDISYSAAWQLGRTMAIADRPFVAALCNVRRQIYERGVEAARVAHLKDVTTFKSRSGLLVSITETVEGLSKIHTSGRVVNANTMKQRWRREPVEPLDLMYSGKGVSDDIRPFMLKAALEVASTPKPNEPTEPSEIGYDEFNVPFSADWVVVLRWILDKFFLASVPSHYLLTDASHLPRESVRFFNIDSNWLYALVDGALSLGNHIDQTGDNARDGIKEAINRYLSSPIQKLEYLPPIPRYGCYVRSALVTKFPDLKIEITLPSGTKELNVEQPPMLLRHEIVAQDTMLCLFAQPPSASTWISLSFTQPPHQQSFIAGEKITYAPPGSQDDQSKENYHAAGTAAMDYRRAYTVVNPVDDHFEDAFPNLMTLNTSTGASPMYLWWRSDPTDPLKVLADLRLVVVDNYATGYLNTLNKEIPKDSNGNPQFQDDTPTSALMGYGFNDPCWQLEIGLARSDAVRALGSPSQKPYALPVPPILGVRKRRPISASAVISSTEHYEKPVNLRTHGIRTTPVPPAQPGPHIKPVPTVSIESRTDAGPMAFDALPGGPPPFMYFFYSANHPGKPGASNDPVAMGGAAQDIICSITLNPLAANLWELQTIEMDIPIGPAPGSRSERFNLTNQAGGFGAFMLSNLRFNPRVSTSSDGLWLRIALVPRSTTKKVKVASCTDMSFMLTGVRVNLSDNVPSYAVAPKIMERYSNNQSSGPGPDQRNQRPPAYITLKLPDSSL